MKMDQLSHRDERNVILMSWATDYARKIIGRLVDIGVQGTLNRCTVYMGSFRHQGVWIFYINSRQEEGLTNVVVVEKNY